MLEVRFTVEDYHLMADAGLFSEGAHTELLDGKVYVVTPVGRRHAHTVAKLTRLFAPALDRAVLWPQNPIQIPPHGEPEPDLALLKPREDEYEHALPQPEDVLLLIEVSDTTLPTDRSVKVPMYARARIPEVWLVNLIENEVEVYRAPKGSRYETREVAPFGQALRPLNFPDLAVTL